MRAKESPRSAAALLGGRGPFRYRGGVRRLLGMGPPGVGSARPAGFVPPVGFRYLAGGSGELRVARPPAIRASTPELDHRERGAGRAAPERTPSSSAPSDLEEVSIADAKSRSASPAVPEGPEPAHQEPRAQEPPVTSAPASQRTVERTEPPAGSATLAPRPSSPAAAAAAARREPTARPEAGGVEEGDSGEGDGVSPARPERLEALSSPVPPAQRAFGARRRAGSPDPQAGEPRLPRPGAEAADAGARQPEPPEPPEPPSEQQREAALRLLERMGAKMPLPREEESPAPTLAQGARPGSTGPPRRPSSSAEESGLREAPAEALAEITPPRPHLQRAEARLARLRRVTGQLTAPEPVPQAASAERPEPTKRSRRAAGPGRQTIVVRRPPRPSKVPAAFWRRNRLNLSRLWLVR